MSTANDADLICEALVREIGRAKRFSAMREAWLALAAVRRVASQMEQEAAILHPQPIDGAVNISGMSEQAHRP